MEGRRTRSGGLPDAWVEGGRGDGRAILPRDQVRDSIDRLMARLALLLVGSSLYE